MKSVFGPNDAYTLGMSALPRSLVLALCAALLASALSRRAHADESDTLPAIDDSAPVALPEAPPIQVAPPPVVLPVVNAVSYSRKKLPIRARRRLALLGEVGWNGIAGFGPNLVFHADPHVSFDLGAGLSLLGWKVGLRGRYNVLTGPVTPFLGVGVMGAAGFGDSPIPINDNGNGNVDVNRRDGQNTVNIKILPSAFLQTVGGVDWTSAGGFTLLGTVGYAFLLSHDPVQIISGTPTHDEQRAFDVLFRSNVVITGAVGYSFR